MTDDVDLFARAAVGRLAEQPRLLRAEAVEGVILADACRWYALRVESIDDRSERTEIVARVVDRGRLRDFFGFNRAKHAVIEAAILATRIEFLESAFIRGEFERLAIIVGKTGGRQEHAAFEFLQRYLREQLAGRDVRGGRGSMRNSVAVRTPCRLHFGMFSFGRRDVPQFGGVGVMVEPPNVEASFAAAESFSV